MLCLLDDLKESGALVYGPGSKNDATGINFHISSSVQRRINFLRILNHILLTWGREERLDWGNSTPLIFCKARVIIKYF